MCANCGRLRLHNLPNFLLDLIGLPVKKLIELTNEEARSHFLKGSSYFNGDLPSYISFEPLLKDVASALKGGYFDAFKASDPKNLSGVNYSFIANKDGRFAWRPYELMHPAIYVSLVNLICDDSNWAFIQARVMAFNSGIVQCCSAPVMALDGQRDVAAQVKGWWQKVEQQSLTSSLEFAFLLHTDVTDCYGSLYTHSISWALHGLEAAKASRGKGGLLGDKIDAFIQASRYGQTNGIAQGSVLMDFIAELVLGYVDEEISAELAEDIDFKILRYRDDYRIFTNSAEQAEKILKIISDKLRSVGMKLGVAKTFASKNVIEGAIKPDKLAGIELQDLGESNAKTLQKQLLRLHAFGQRFPNSGALRRLLSDFHTSVLAQQKAPDDIGVQVAIATDIGFVSPSTFPVIAGVLSHLISLAPVEDRSKMWELIRLKMKKVPYNGYLEIWLQRIIQPQSLGAPFVSNEAICQIVNGENRQLWDSSWISSTTLTKAIDAKKIVTSEVKNSPKVIQPQEVLLFKEKSLSY